MFEIMRTADTYGVLSKKAKALQQFVEMIEGLTELALTLPLDELLDELMGETGYRIALTAQGVEGQVRLENIEELKTNLVKYSEENGDEATLSGFLEEVSLYTDLDSMNASDEMCIRDRNKDSYGSFSSKYYYRPGRAGAGSNPERD